MRFQFGSGRTTICPVTAADITGNLTASTYYFWIQARNDIGYTLFSPETTIATTGGIRLTLPADCHRNGENWVFYAISVNTTNDPATAKLLLQFPAVDASQNPISLPLDIDLTEPEHLLTEQTVATLPTAGDLVDGMIREYSVNSQLYRYSSTSTATVDGDAVLSATPSGRWLLHRDGFSSYINDIEDNLKGADVSVLEVDENNIIVNLDYALDGGVGSRRRFWFYNDTQTNIPVNKRFGLTVELQGEDISDTFYSLFKTVFRGHWDRTTETLITTLPDNVTDLPYLDVIDEYGPGQDSFVVTREIEPGQAWVVDVYPEFSSNDLGSNTLPASGSEIDIIGFSLVNSSTATDLGDFLGDSILPTDANFRRVVPLAGLSVKALSGISVVNDKNSGDTAETTISGLTADTSGQLLAINGNGNVYTALSISPNEAQRAVIDTSSGISNVSALGNELQGTADPTIDVTITYPSAIRSNYPDVIAGNSQGDFNAESVTFYVNKRSSPGGTITETREFTGFVPSNTTSDNFSFQFSTGTLSPTIPSTDFGLWTPNAPNITSVTSGTDSYYDIAAAFVYSGNSVTGIDHSVGSGNIQEITATFGEISTSAFYWRSPSNTIANLSALAADQLVDGANYTVRSDAAGKNAIYTYVSSDSQIPNGDTIVDATNGAGNFLRVTGLDGTNGFGLDYLFDTDTSSGPAVNYLRLNNSTLASVTEIYVNETSNSIDYSSFLTTIENGSLIRISSREGSFVLFTVSGAPTDNGSDRTIPVTFVGSSGSFLADDEILLSFSQKGADGADGANGSDGADGTDGISSFGLRYNFNSATTSPAASGEIRLNNITYSSVTELYIHETDRNSVSVSGILDQISDTSTLLLLDESDESVYAYYQLTSQTDNGSERTFVVSHLASNGNFSGEVSLVFSAAGSQGLAGTDGISGFGLRYSFNAATTSPPASGEVRLNNSTYSSATELYVHETDRNSNDVSSVLTQISDTSVIQIVDENDSSTYAYYQLTSQTDNGSERTFSITHLASSGTLAGDVSLTFATAGSQGPAGTNGTNGSDGADGTDGVSGFGIRYNFSATTTSPPSSGELRLNNATLASVTEIYVHETDKNSVDVSSVLTEISDGSTIQILDDNDTNAYAYFTLSSQTDNGTDRTFTVTHLSSNGTLTGDVSLAFATAGPQGPSGSDESVKVSANDTTSGFLNGKLVQGTNITFTENNDGGNETLTISATGGGGSALEVEDNGSSLTTNASKINFVGFTLTEPVADEITVTSSGGGGGSATHSFEGDTTGTDGFTKLPTEDGTLLIQWGTGTATSGAGTVTFPEEFANTDYSFEATVDTGTVSTVDRTIHIATKTTTACDVNVTVNGAASSAGFNWVAMGLANTATGAINTSSSNSTSEILTETVIEEDTLTSASTSKTFSTIPSGYDYIAVRILGQLDSATNGPVQLTINGDTTDINYDRQNFFAAGGSIIESDANNSRIIGYVGGSSAVNGILGEMTAKFKAGYEDSGSGIPVITEFHASETTTNNRLGFIQTHYKQNTALTSILLEGNAGASFISGTTFQLIGYRKETLASSTSETIVARKVLEEVNLVATTPSITFSSIDQTYDDLIIELYSLNSADNGAAVNVFLNGDTTSGNYTTQRNAGFNNAATVDEITGSFPGVSNDSSNSSEGFTTNIFKLSQYTDGNTKKVTGIINGPAVADGWWSGTSVVVSSISAAINEILLQPSAGSFASGVKARLIGVKEITLGSLSSSNNAPLGEFISTGTETGTVLTIAGGLSSYSKLKLEASGLSIDGTYVSSDITFNGDTGANYWRHSSATRNSNNLTTFDNTTDTSIRCAEFPQNTGFVGTTELSIYNESASLPKGVMGQNLLYRTDSSFNGQNQAIGGSWNNTSAKINSLEITISSALVAGSFIRIYGERT